ncbi:DMT family transporter [Roseovarius rhodophyticola]|uniref:DMT family transporter n=1 Tax=Roseovarius rhodophyticola TaxID=3080827 RepID=A0ABZ2TG32_9RHOB|nr:DMT family transporter [Roseovarius sp. W115]MDV2928865.1 DMT family transporter [Roseovarius sp. W115]
MAQSQTQPNADQVQNVSLGIASAVAVLIIWSAFFVFSRAGVQTTLTAGDIAALRFTVAGVICLPFLWAWWPRHIPIWAAAILSMTGPGMIYTMCMYIGLSEASVAYAGVFSNGALPIFTGALVAYVSHQLPGRIQAAALAMIVIGAVLVGSTGVGAGNGNVWLGIALFLTSAAIQSIYIFSLRHWKVKPRQALVLVNIPNALLFLPIWALFLPSGMAETPLSTILGQALFQGLGPGFLAVILFSLAANHLGPNGTAGFSAAVPATAAVLAIPVLGEIPVPLEWAGIGLVSLGLILLVRAR